MTSAKEHIEGAKSELAHAAKSTEEYVAQYGSNSVGSHIRLNLYSKAVRDIGHSIHSYHTALHAIESDLRTRSAQDIRLVDPTLSDDEVNRLIDSDSSGRFITDRLLSPSFDLEQRLRGIETRHAEIRRIAREVEYLSQLFRDISMLVDQQQETIDIIERRIMSSQRDTLVAEEKIVKAEQWMTTRTKLKCCCAVLLLAILAVVLTPILIKTFRK